MPIAEIAAMTDPETPAPDAPAPEAPDPLPIRRRSWLPASTAILLGLVGLVLIARVFYLGNLQIRSADMAPTLVVGDRLLVRKSAYGLREHRVPERGDLIVFRSPEQPGQDFVQRVIGLPGDTIAVRQGIVFINGWRVPTCVGGIADIAGDGEEHAGIALVELLGDTAYLVLHDDSGHRHADESAEAPPGAEVEGPYTVPQGEVFVLGDNREHSRDSRRWFDGRGTGVRVDEIKGRASTVWMSFKKAGGIAWARTGSSPSGATRCPEGFLPATCTGFEKCLASRPPRATTTPPAPK